MSVNAPTPYIESYKVHLLRISDPHNDSMSFTNSLSWILETIFPSLENQHV